MEGTHCHNTVGPHSADAHLLRTCDALATCVLLSLTCVLLSPLLSLSLSPLSFFLSFFFVCFLADGFPHAWFTQDTPITLGKVDSVRGIRVLNGSAGQDFITREYYYQIDQEAGLFWYHDHSMGTTALNAYAGLAGLYMVRDHREHQMQVQHTQRHKRKKEKQEAEQAARREHRSHSAALLACSLSLSLSLTPVLVCSYPVCFLLVATSGH